jgi:hypothetical protein
MAVKSNVHADQVAAANAGKYRGIANNPTMTKEQAMGGSIYVAAKSSGSKYSGKSSGRSSGKSTAAAEPIVTGGGAPAFSYAENPNVANAYSQLQAVLANAPGDFSSQYSATLNSLYNQIANRPKFAYDFNKDAMYRMYKDNYINQGRKAMEDTIGTASGLTGGYASSYSQTAGQQTYQNYLQKLNDMIMTLRNNAKEEYDDEGNRLNNLFGLANTMYGHDWDAYRAKVSDYQADRSYHASRYDAERAQNNADRDFAYKMYLASLG